MINLVRNELCKILSKKAIYVYTIIVLFLLVFMAGVSRNFNEEIVVDSSYADALEDGLSSYDLTDSYELSMYIGDRAIIDKTRLSVSYKEDSPERYYIDTVIQPLMVEKYTFEYKDKDLESAKKVETEIQDGIKKIKNFDWKQYLLEEKVRVEKNIKDLEAMLVANNEKIESNIALETLKIELWCLNYRIENKIPFSYGAESNVIDAYKEDAVKYLSIVKDESLIKNHDDLVEKRRIESNYKVALYKLENGLVNKNESMLEYIVSCFSYIDGLIVVAIIIICGSIISEEFNKGTIKQLLTKPFSRWKILTSKIIASLLVIFVFALLYNTVFILANCYEYNDFSSVLGTSVVYDFNLGKVREVNFLLHCLYGFVSVLPAYIILFLIVLFIGILTTNSVACISGGFLIYLFNDLLSLWLKPKVLSYIPFACWDLSSFMFGRLSSNAYASFGKSLAVDIITILVLLVLSYILFNKKEVKNQ